MGAKKRPFYRIVAIDSRLARDGRFVEILGTYNPIEKPAIVSIVEDKMCKWIEEGAVMSDTVNTLLAQVGFWEKYNKAKKGEDVSAMVLRKTITERPKKTRRMKKASVAETAASA
jgi:small subunit ribosomal protein S16